MPDFGGLLGQTTQALGNADQVIGSQWTANRDKNNPAIAKSRVGAYQGGLQTNFTGTSGGTDYHGYANDYGAMQDDRDVKALQTLVNDDYSGTHGNQGVDFSANAAMENMYRGRIGEKNSLAEQIAGSDNQLAKQQDLNKATAGSAVGEGLKNTRQNFNNRGLLYSGARQGGEAAVRAQGASQLASSMAGTARDAANSKTAAQNAYASVDFASQQDSLNRATQAFDTASANNIARLQSMQQLGQGLGGAVGSIMGSSSPQSSPGPSTFSWSSNSQPGNGLLGGNQNQMAVG